MIYLLFFLTGLTDLEQITIKYKAHGSITYQSDHQLTFIKNDDKKSETGTCLNKWSISLSETNNNIEEVNSAILYYKELNSIQPRYYFTGLSENRNDKLIKSLINGYPVKSTPISINKLMASSTILPFMPEKAVSKGDEWICKVNTKLENFTTSPIEKTISVKNRLTDMILEYGKNIAVITYEFDDIIDTRTLDYEWEPYQKHGVYVLPVYVFSLNGTAWFDIDKGVILKKEQHGKFHYYWTKSIPESKRRAHDGKQEDREFHVSLHARLLDDAEAEKLMAEYEAEKAAEEAEKERIANLPREPMYEYILENKINKITRSSEALRHKRNASKKIIVYNNPELPIESFSEDRKKDVLNDFTNLIFPPTGKENKWNKTKELLCSVQANDIDYTIRFISDPALLKEGDEWEVDKKYFANIKRRPEYLKYYVRKKYKIEHFSFLEIEMKYAFDFKYPMANNLNINNKTNGYMIYNIEKNQIIYSENIIDTNFYHKNLNAVKVNTDVFTSAGVVTLKLVSDNDDDGLDAVSVVNSAGTASGLKTWRMKLFLTRWFRRLFWLLLLLIPALLFKYRKRLRIRQRVRHLYTSARPDTAL
jgi:hypothetical protein